MNHASTMALGCLAVVGALSGATLALSGDGAQATPKSNIVVLTDVNVVDVKVGKVLPHRTIVITGNRITAVQEMDSPLAPDALIVSGHGDYVIPGLWDMHAHVIDEQYLDLFVANGITGVRDMGGGLAQPSDGCESLKTATLQKWRSEVVSGRRIGPELVISGPVVSGTGWPTSLRARTPHEARVAVRTLQQQHVDFIKVYEAIPLPAYRALALEAKKVGLWFAGHVPEEVAPLAAVEAGQRSIEHIRDPLLVCFTDNPAELDRFFTEDGWSKSDKQWGRTANASCPALIAALQTSATWLTPTLTVEKAKVSVENAAHIADPRRQLLPQSVRNGYAAYVNRKRSQPASERASERLWWRTQQRLVNRMSSAGVKLLAGTDAACEGGLPGYSLHEELSELVAAGLSPLDALRAATIEPARYFGRSDEGQVAPGHRANLLVLYANPLSDIANSRRIKAVVLEGKVLLRERLDELARDRQQRR